MQNITRDKESIQYRTLQEFNHDSLVHLYDSVGWTSYTDTPNIFKNLFKESLYVYAAFKHEELIGLIRVVGDGLSIIYIQDILVNPIYQRHGIGSNLINHVLSVFNDVRQKVLLTDNTPQTEQFYKSIGFKDTNDLNLICFYK